MYEQGYITHEQFTEGRQQALPAPDDIEPPTLDSEGALLHRLAAPAAGRPLRRRQGLLRRPQGQDDARPAPPGRGRRSGQLLPGRLARDRLGRRHRQPATPASRRWSAGPTSRTKPFNLATLGHRQPGSSIKPFILLTALEQGISPYTIYESAQQEFSFGKKGQETFVVNNDEGAYAGLGDLVYATTNSDNSVYAQLASKA